MTMNSVFWLFGVWVVIFLFNAFGAFDYIARKLRRKKLDRNVERGKR